MNNTFFATTIGQSTAGTSPQSHFFNLQQACGDQLLKSLNALNELRLVMLEPSHDGLSFGGYEPLGTKMSAYVENAIAGIEIQDLEPTKFLLDEMSHILIELQQQLASQEYVRAVTQYSSQLNAVLPSPLVTCKMAFSSEVYQQRLRSDDIFLSQNPATSVIRKNEIEKRVHQNFQAKAEEVCALVWSLSHCIQTYESTLAGQESSASANENAMN